MGDPDRPRTADAVAAAVAVARRLGLPAGAPRVLGERSSLIVHLAPTGVVARVAFTTAVVRPGPAWLGREVAVARFLSERGAAIVPPARELDPGPHEHDGHWLTFWTLVEPRGAVDPAGAGRGLRDLHDRLAGYAGELPSFDPRPEVETICRLVERRGRGDAAALLRRVSDRLAVPGVAARPLHGDAHLNNVIAPDRWLDFEDACAGPVEWDLASLVASFHVFGEPRRAGLAALAAYGDHDAPLLSALVPLRLLWTAAWGCLGSALAGALHPQTASRLKWLRARHG